MTWLAGRADLLGTLVRGKPGLRGHATFSKPGMRTQVTDLTPARPLALVEITHYCQAREQEKQEEGDEATEDKYHHDCKNHGQLLDISSTLHP